MRKTILALSLMLFGALAQADVTVKDSWVRGTTPAQKATGAFMEITSTDAASTIRSANRWELLSLRQGSTKIGCAC